jgi:hypothetical protein
MIRVKKRGEGNKLSKRLAEARLVAEKTTVLADDIKLLGEWMKRDILGIIGPDVSIREALFDFIVAELKARETQAPHRIGPVRKKLENQRNDLLRFARLLDEALANIAEEYGVEVYLVRSMLLLQDLALSSNQRQEKEEKLRKVLRRRFYAIQEAVKKIADEVVRASSVIENLNSRLRNYFFLRRQIGGSYLELLRFFFNHRRFMRSEHADRVNKSPKELLTGQSHPHWLDLLRLSPGHEATTTTKRDGSDSSVVAEKQRLNSAHSSAGITVRQAA